MMFIFYNTQFIMVIVLITFILKMSPIKRKKYILTNHQKKKNTNDNEF